MSFRKIQRTPIQANLPRATVIRQKYAVVMLPLLAAGKRIINIDETWLPFLDYRNHRWEVKGKSNSFSCKDLVPRVNMIAALDTLGKVYVALT